MTMVYIPREGAKFGDGDKIKWEIGEPAVFHAADGTLHNVTIALTFARCAAAPAKRCLDVVLNDSGERYTVLAERLEPRGGFPPASGFTFNG